MVFKSSSSSTGAGSGPLSGITAASKGDLLAGTSSNTFVNLPVGPDGTQLIADSASTDGVNWFPQGGVFCPGYVSGRLYGGCTSASWVTLALSANTQYFTSPLMVFKTSTWSGLQVFATVAVAISAHVGIYSATAGGVAGSLVTGSDTTATLNAAAVTNFTFASPITLSPGVYFPSILVNGACTLTATASLSQNGVLVFGSADLGTNATGTGTQPSSAQTFGALPPTAGAFTYTAGNTAYIAFKAN